MENAARLRRWRLILGQESQQRLEGMGDCSLGAQGDLMDQALAAIYDRTGQFSQGSGGAGKGPSNPQISKWLGDVRSLFDKELVTVIQGDAMTRCGLQQLIFEPELLEDLEDRGHVRILRPQIPVIKNTEDRVDVLTAFYQHGYEYAKDNFSQIADFLKWEPGSDVENHRTQEQMKHG